MFCFPLLLLLISGWGYADRHTISFAPCIFALVAFAPYHLLSTWPWTRYLAVLVCGSIPCLLLTGLADKASIVKSGMEDYEWSTDYKSRDKVAKYLATTLGVTPQQYQDHAFWWFYSRSMDAAIYRRLHDACVHATASTPSPTIDLAPNESLLLLGLPISREFMNSFDVTPLGRIEDISIYRARHKTLPLAVSNTVNPSRLSPFESAIELSPSLLAFPWCELVSRMNLRLFSRCTMGESEYVIFFRSRQVPIHLFFAGNAYPLTSVAITKR